MKTIALVGVVVGVLAAAACDGDRGPVTSNSGTAGTTGGAAGTSGAAGTTGGAAGTSGAAGTTGGAAGTSGAAGAPVGSAGMNGTCGKVQPCGGSVVGTWTSTATCILKAELTDPDLAAACPAAKIEALGGSVNATSTFTATTYQNTGTISLKTRLTMPLSCFGAGRDCAALQQVYVDQGFFQSPTCAVQGTSCVCALNAVQDAAESGTYTTSGTTLTTTNVDGTSTDPYCVVGNDLHTIELDMAMPMGPMGMANIQTDVVFTKR